MNIVKTISKFLSAAVLLLTTFEPLAQVLTYTVGSDIPDNDPSGLANAQNVSLAYQSIGQISVQLQIVSSTAGDTPWNGDFYAYLEHNGTTAVLLNRVGRNVNSPSDPGSSATGMNVTLFDGAPNGNIHTSPSAGLLTGSWAPDGRNTAPGFGIASHPVTAPLDLFQGVDPNGRWTLFIADLGAGNEAQLSSWGLTITPVPEPASATLATGVALLLVLLGRKALQGN